MPSWYTDPRDYGRKFYPHGRFKWGTPTLQGGVQEYPKKKKNGNRLASRAEVARLQRRSVVDPVSQVVVRQEVTTIRQAEIIQQFGEIPAVPTKADSSGMNFLPPEPIKVRMVEKIVSRPVVVRQKIDKHGDVPQYRACKHAFPPMKIR